MTDLVLTVTVLLPGLADIRDAGHQQLCKTHALPGMSCTASSRLTCLWPQSTGQDADTVSFLFSCWSPALRTSCHAAREGCDEPGLTCLAIGKDADVVAIHDAGHHRPHFSKDLLLAAVQAKDGVIAVPAALGLPCQPPNP